MAKEIKTCVGGVVRTVPLCRAEVGGGNARG